MSVESRIVTMKFDNRQFEADAKVSLTTLQRIKDAIGTGFTSVAGGAVKAIGGIGSAFGKLSGLKSPFTSMIGTAQKGLGVVGSMMDRIGLKNPFAGGVQSASELQRAAQAAGGPAGMGVLEGGVVSVSNKFIALSTIAITALSNITNRAITAGTAFAKSFTIQPVLDGLNEYQTNLQAIQTVQANTDRPLPEINDALQKLNAYSDQTIYNFGEMAKNVGTFTAAGVDLETSVSAIKGIANMAALSGSNSQQAATAMYQLSQALASGKVGLMDWNSVVNAGMGGKKLQGALAQTAVAMGQINAEQIKGLESGEQLTIMGKSFRESIMAQPGQESWLTSEILKNSLAALDGRYSHAAIAQETLKNGTLRYSHTLEGAAAIEKRINDARKQAAKDGVVYTDEQFKALQELSTKAFQAATKVKTLGQVFDIAKETIGSGWSASFQNIFGNLKEAKQLFTGMSNGLNDIIKQNALARNNMLAAWKKGGGRDTLIDGLKDGWNAVYGIIKAVGRGFHDIFPKQDADSLLSLTDRFAAFTKSLIPSKATLHDIRDISAGVFSVFHIGLQIIGAAVDMFKNLFGAVGGGKGDFLDFAGGIGEAITNFDKFLEKSDLLENIFSGIGAVLAVPLSLLRGIGEVIGAIFGGFDSGAADKVKDGIGSIGDRLSGLEVIGQHIRDFFSGVADFFSNFGQRIGSALAGIGDVIANMFTAETFGSTLDVINTTLLGGIVLMIKSFFNQGLNIDLTGGLFDGIKETLGAATGAFENMQQTLKADILLKIAGAIAVMAGALLVLSMIDPGALTKALAAMTTGFGILVGALFTLMKVMGPMGLIQMYVVTSALTKLSFSILLLSFALKVMSSISFGDMLRGLFGLGVALFIITKAMVPLSAGSKGMARASGSLILVGIALNILAVALKLFATMSWEEIAKGLITMTGAIAGIGLAMRLMPKGIVLQAAGILVLSVAINALAVAMKVFATMSWEDMIKGLTGVVGSIAAIGIAMRLMPKGMLIQAVALVAVSGALVILSGALKVMGGMGWDEIARGLVVLAGSMIILAAGLQAIGIVGTIGAAGLLITAAALAILVPLLIAMGAMSWESIGKSLAMLVGLFTILGVAATLAGVQIVILGAGMLLLGAGVALVGAGLLMAATAFGILVGAASAGAQVLGMMMGEIINSIPAALAAFGRGIVQFAQAIGRGAPKIATAFGRVLGNLLDQVAKNAPKLGKAFMAMLNTALNVITKMSPKITEAGLVLIVSFLRAISNHIGEITKIAGDIIVKFLGKLGNELPRIQEAGVKLIIKFINGTANAIDEHSYELGQAAGRLGVAIIEGIARGIAGGVSTITSAARDAASDALHAAMDFLGVNSPSKVFRDEVGKPISEGMALGIKEGTPWVTGEVQKLGKTALDKMGESMRGISDAMSVDPNFNPTISPVLDLAALTKEANKMSSILNTVPIIPTVSYATAADISVETQTSAEIAAEAAEASTGGGDTHIEYHQHLHSPTPLDSTKMYRSGKSLIALKKEEVGVQ